MIMPMRSPRIDWGLATRLYRRARAGRFTLRGPLRPVRTRRRTPIPLSLLPRPQPSGDLAARCAGAATRGSTPRAAPRRAASRRDHRTDSRCDNAAVRPGPPSVAYIDQGCARRRSLTTQYARPVAARLLLRPRTDARRGRPPDGRARGDGVAAARTDQADAAGGSRAPAS